MVCAFSALTLLVGQRWDAGVVMSGSRCRFAYGLADAIATHYGPVAPISVNCAVS